jgi:hypothetical protein
MDGPCRRIVAQLVEIEIVDREQTALLQIRLGDPPAAP